MKGLKIPDTSINLDELFTEPLIVEVAGPKFVSITPRKDFHCTIGGIRYEFYKNKSQKVPETVEKVLQRNPSNLG